MLIMDYSVKDMWYKVKPVFFNSAVNFWDYVASVVIDEHLGMDYWNDINREKGSTKKGICSISTLLTTNPTWSGLGLNLYKEEFMRYEYMCYEYLYEWWDG
jgi:hypothetical protein